MSSTTDPELAKRVLHEQFDANPVLFTRQVARGRENLSGTLLAVVSHPRCGVDCVARLVSTALGWRYSETRQGVIVSGYGLNRGSHLTSSLSQCLYGNGYTIRHQSF